MKQIGFGFLALIYSLSAFSCEVPPQEQRAPYCKLIERTKLIVVAELTGTKEVDPKQGEFEYRFEIHNVVKGKVSKNTIFLIGGSPVKGEKLDHERKEFWQDGWGRTLNDTDCEVHPGFERTKNYLIFVDRPYHVKSFEQIQDNNDPWLVEVRKAVLGKCKERTK